MNKPNPEKYPFDPDLGGIWRRAVLAEPEPEECEETEKTLNDYTINVTISIPRSVTICQLEAALNEIDGELLPVQQTDGQDSIQRVLTEMRAFNGVDNVRGGLTWADRIESLLNVETQDNEVNWKEQL